ncbi:MAG: PIN domain-containing protein [Spirochaetota bacterium]
MSKVFFDTNVLVYQMDKNDLKKRDTCRNLVRKAASQGNAVISTQVLQEFYVATTTKLHVDPILIKSIMHTFENMEVIIIAKDLINEAIDASLQYKLAFWDSLIVVAAESAKCELLYSEDLHHGQIIRNVKILNPLK